MIEQKGLKCSELRSHEIVWKVTSKADVETQDKGTMVKSPQTKLLSSTGVEQRACRQDIPRRSF